MKVLLINGSPHKNGCTYTALKEVADTLNKNGVETEIYHIGTKPVASCIACRSCAKTGKCFVDDDVNVLNSRVDEFDGIVLGSPVYYAAASGQLTSFLNRLFFSSNGKFDGKLGACVVSCRRGGAASTFDQLNKYFTISNMPVAPSQYWNQVHGSNAQEVLEDKEGLQTMRTLGNNMAWLLKCIELGRQNGITVPAREDHIFTNFIR